MTEYLIKNYKFRKQLSSERGGIRNPLIDCDCYLRIHQNIFLTWNQRLKHFSLVAKSEKEKGAAGGRDGTFKEVVIPKPFYKVEEVEDLMEVLNIRTHEIQSKTQKGDC